jgi:hypothetical protein
VKAKEIVSEDQLKKLMEDFRAINIVKTKDDDDEGKKRKKHEIIPAILQSEEEIKKRMTWAYLAEFFASDGSVVIERIGVACAADHLWTAEGKKCQTRSMMASAKKTKWHNWPLYWVCLNSSHSHHARCCCRTLLRSSSEIVLRAPQISRAQCGFPTWVASSGCSSFCFSILVRQPRKTRWMVAMLMTEKQNMQHDMPVRCGQRAHGMTISTRTPEDHQLLEDRYWAVCQMKHL